MINMPKIGRTVGRILGLFKKDVQLIYTECKL